MRASSRCGRWVLSLGGALDDVISGQCVFKFSNLTSLPCFQSYLVFRYIMINQHPYIALHFSKNVFLCYFDCMSVGGWMVQLGSSALWFVGMTWLNSLPYIMKFSRALYLSEFSE